MDQPLPTEPSQDLPIDQIEAAINVWRNRSPASQGTDEPLVLCREARVLADVYGLMIVGRQASVPLSSLSASQLAALQEAFA
jgi:hypothetical protein